MWTCRLADNHRRIGSAGIHRQLLMPSSSSSLLSRGSAAISRSGIWPGKSLRQKLSTETGATDAHACSTTAGVAICPGIRKALKERRKSEKVIAMPVGDIEMAVRFPAGSCNPIRQCLRLFDGEERVDQDGIAFAVDQRG